jgi:hypothetical protein
LARFGDDQLSGGGGSIYDACLIEVRLAEEKPAEALDLGLRMLGPTIKLLTPAHDSVRDVWPDTLHAALRLGRHEDAHHVIGMLADLPPGHIPPYLRAQLARGRALLNAAEGHHDTVEPDLNTAIDAFDTLGYPYWRAVTQSDLAGWLIDQQRADDANPLLDRAIITLQQLRATPALTRAQAISRTATGPLAESSSPPGDSNPEPLHYKL